MTGSAQRPPNPDGSYRCCRRCEERDQEGMTPMQRMLGRSFIVCPICGNKRCPKATDHNLACTNSNEPGQPGSDY